MELKPTKRIQIIQINKKDMEFLKYRKWLEDKVTTIFMIPTYILNLKNSHDFFTLKGIRIIQKAAAKSSPKKK